MDNPKTQWTIQRHNGQSRNTTHKTQHGKGIQKWTFQRDNTDPPKGKTKQTKLYVEKKNPLSLDTCI